MLISPLNITDMVGPVTASSDDDVTTPSNSHVITSLSERERERVPGTVTRVNLFVRRTGATQITAPCLGPDRVLLLTWGHRELVSQRFNKLIVMEMVLLENS